MMMEIFKDIEGYEGLYQVSNLGRVKSLKTNKFLVQYKNNRNYSIVHLYKDGKMYNRLVHRLVALAFIPNDDPEHKTQVNHIREFDKDCNAAHLLEWCTPKYNCNYGTRNKRFAEKRSIPVVGIDPNTWKIIHEFSSATEAERSSGFVRSAVSHCCNLEKGYYTYKGLVWRYKKDLPYSKEEYIEWIESVQKPRYIVKKLKPVVAIDLYTGEIVQEFNSIKDAETEGFDWNIILCCCKGKCKTHKDLAWRFKSEMPDKEGERDEWLKSIIKTSIGYRRKFIGIDPISKEIVYDSDDYNNIIKHGFKRENIMACCRGKSKSYKGLIWCYKGTSDEEIYKQITKLGKRSEETKRKISDALRGKKKSEEHVRKMSKPVIAISPETGKVVVGFPSANEAGRNGFDSSGVSACCRGKRKTYKGLIWRYK